MSQERLVEEEFNLVHFYYEEIQADDLNSWTLESTERVRSIYEVIDGLDRQTSTHPLDELDIDDNPQMFVDRLLDAYPDHDEDFCVSLINGFSDSMKTRAREPAKYAVLILYDVSLLLYYTDSEEMTITKDSIPEQIPDEVSNRVKERLEYQSKVDSLNLDLLDYLRPWSDGLKLENVGVCQPPEGVGDTKLAATKEDYENIRVGTVTCDCEDENTDVVHATARYKPEDEDAYETDQWGYTETEPMPAMRLTDLSETESDLLETFVTVAVEKADGFAGFRETATKTNSLVDRLEEITLPDPDDVVDDLERYRDAVKRAEELDEKIQRTDDLIDEIVYDLYGLTDEEIKIVEETVADD